ncbi:unnamed protein product [Pylaiella littoralis]
MVRAGLALWALTVASIGTTTLQARTAERSILGKKIRHEDVVRVQDARLDRLSKRIERMSEESAILAERARQHREMRLKGNAELKERVEELKLKLQTERERMREDFEGQLMAVREEMWAQAARDRDALEAELGLRHEEERSRFLEEANERALEVIEEVKINMAAEAERDRELYAQRAALAEEGNKLAREDRKQLQAEKDDLARQLQETMEMEDANRKKIILKFKSRENLLRKNFEARLREVRLEGEGGDGVPMPAEGGGHRPRAAKSKVASPTNTAASSVRERQRAAVRSSAGGAAPPSGVTAGATPTAQR